MFGNKTTRGVNGSNSEQKQEITANAISKSNK
jgi:hypothetical protein